MLDITESCSVSISDGTVSYEMEPKSVSLLVISKEQDYSAVSEIQESPEPQETQNIQQNQNKEADVKPWLIFRALVVAAAGIAAVLKLKKKS